MNNFRIIGKVIEINKKGVIVSVKETFIQNEEVDLEVSINGAMKEHIDKYCEVGNIIVIQGKICAKNELIAEKISFISKNK